MSTIWAALLWGCASFTLVAAYAAWAHSHTEDFASRRNADRTWALIFAITTVWISVGALKVGGVL